jgi:hypothetical protein
MCIIIFGVLGIAGAISFLLPSSMNMRISWWLNHPSQEIDWQDISLTVPRGWDARIDDERRSLGLMSVIGTQEESEYDPEFIRIDFFKLSSPINEKNPEEIVWERLYQKYKSVGEDKVVNINGKSASLKIVSRTTKKGKPYVFILGSIPSAQIKFNGEVNKVSTVYRVLSNIKWQE